mmetsp:Transcript_16425/g.30927  ORF Transcript_16425/g.30927 Transcript_16425/m.30927 type:complete len:110 (+) Transcript_16425:751-1080(+)
MAKANLSVSLFVSLSLSLTHDLKSPEMQFPPTLLSNSTIRKALSNGGMRPTKGWGCPTLRDDKINGRRPKRRGDERRWRKPAEYHPPVLFRNFYSIVKNNDNVIPIDPR